MRSAIVALLLVSTPASTRATIDPYSVSQALHVDWRFRLWVVARVGEAAQAGGRESAERATLAHAPDTASMRARVSGEQLPSRCAHPSLTSAARL